MADTWKSYKQDRNKTPDSHDMPEDVTKHKDAKKYPNYYVHKTRSGHSILIDDTEEYESITIQHRTGTEIQFLPDGALVFRVNKGKHEQIHGESNIIITGKHDITVQGDASLRVTGDCRTTVMGNMESTVDGDFNINARNVNMQSRGGLDISAKHMSLKTEASFEVTSSDQVVIQGAKAAAFGSTDGNAALWGKGKVGIKSTDGKAAVEGGGGVSVRATGGIVAMDGPTIHFNEDLSEPDTRAYVKGPKPTSKTNNPSVTWGDSGSTPKT